MGGGGKGGTSTSTVSIPPEVLARYNAVNARAEKVADTPFQPYGGEFVAPMNEVQQQGVSQTQKYAEAAQPYYQTAAGLTQQAVDATKPLTAAQIQQYQNPYVQSVVDPTLAALRQQQAQDRQAQSAQAIRSGAFGGERAGLQRAVLGGQQELAQAQAISPLYAQAYNSALAAAQQQQGQRVSGLMGAGQQIAGIGTGAQAAGLQGAQAVIGAGTLGQQTQQALDTAKYQQFLQERGYPFQVAQFLANIAEGTGALSGSTTTTTQPTSFFSDERLKHDIKKIGKTNDGLPIYSFKYNGDDRTQIGLMAQDVEKKRPEAVGLAGGYKTVDYAKATAGARHARAAGGLVPESMGGAVLEPGNYARGGFAGGGLITDPNDLQAILAAQKQSFGPFAAGGLYGGSAQQDPRGGVSGYVPKATLPVPKLVTSSFQPKQQQGGLQSAMQEINQAGATAKTLGEGWDLARKAFKSDSQTGTQQKSATTGSSSNPPLPPVRPASLQQTSYDTEGFIKDTDIDKDLFGSVPVARGGGIMPRHHFAGGGFLDPYKLPSSGSMVPEDVMESSEETKDEAEKLQPKASGTGGGSSGGGGGLGTAIGVAKTAFDVGKFILPFFLKDGGVVPRQHFDDGGPAKSQNYAITVPDELIPHFNAASEATGVPVPILAAQAKQESRFNPSATGRAGEVGIGQILPSTARNPGYGMQGVEPTELRDPAKNIMFQAQYMKGIGDKLGVKDWSDPEQTARALRAYNGGGDPNYVQNVFGHLYGSSAPRVSSQAQPPQQGGVKPWYDKIAPQTYQGQDRSMGDFLTSKDFVIPLLTGLGTMASSPSRYLGAAILQGLGGGAQAYAQLQKQQADIGQTLASTGETQMGTEAKRQEMVTASFNVQPDGRATITYRRPDGTVDIMEAVKYFSLPYDQRPRLDPVSEAKLQEYAAKSGLGAAGAGPSPAPAGGLAGGKPAVTGPTVQAPTVPELSGINVNADHVRQMQERARDLEGQGNAVISAQPGAKTFEYQTNLATAAQAQKPQMMSFASSLAALPRGQNILTSGKQQEVLQPLVSVLNGIASTVGMPALVNAQTLANTEEVKKSVNLMAQQAAKGGNQASYAALSEIMSSIPSNLNSPEAQAKLLADIMAVQQREIDKERYFNAVRKQAEGPNGVYARGALGIGADAERAFNDSNAAKIAQEKQSLIRMFNQQAKGHTDNGRPVSVMEYLAKNAGTLSDAQKAAIEKNYGTGILRYFGVGG